MFITLNCSVLYFVMMSLMLLESSRMAFRGGDCCVMQCVEAGNNWDRASRKVLC